MDQKPPQNLFGNRQIKNSNQSKKKYPALETIMSLNKVFAIIVGIGAFFMITTSLSMGSFGILFAIPVLIIAALIILIIIAGNETIRVVIDIEKNTRTNWNQKEE